MLRQAPRPTYAANSSLCIGGADRRPPTSMTTVPADLAQEAVQGRLTEDGASRCRRQRRQAQRLPKKYDFRGCSPDSAATLHSFPCALPSSGTSRLLRRSGCWLDDSSTTISRPKSPLCWWTSGSLNHKYSITWERSWNDVPQVGRSNSGSPNYGLNKKHIDTAHASTSLLVLQIPPPLGLRGSAGAAGCKKPTLQHDQKCNALLDKVLEAPPLKT